MGPKYTGDSIVQVQMVLLTSDFGSLTRGERWNSYYANHPQYSAHLGVQVRTSQHHRQNSTFSPHGRTPTSTVCLNGRQPNSLSTSSKVNSQLSTSLSDLNFNCLPQWQTTQLSVYIAQSQLPTASTGAGICRYYFIMPICFCFFFHLFTLVHLWLTTQSRVNIYEDQ